MPTEGVTNSYSTVAVIPEIPINKNQTLQPFVYYQCPAGKKAKFEGTIRCEDTGAASDVSLRNPDDQSNYCTWGANLSYPWTGDMSAIVIKQEIQVRFTLEAGDVIKTTQNIGTNAQIKINGKVQEAEA